jgi:DNA-binding MarR family transcriptional regulator
VSRQPLKFLSPIHKAGRRIGIHLQEAMDALGIPPGEGHLLSYLRSYAPCPISRLLQVFGHKKSTLTSMLDRMERRGLVRRGPHPDDRRSVLVHLTDAGRAFAERVQVPVDELERRIRAEVRDEDLRGFERVLEAIGRVTAVDPGSPPSSPSPPPNPESKERS